MRSGTATLAADPSIVGRTIPLDDGAYEVVGIMPVGVTYPVGAVRPTDLWVPYVVPESQRIRRPGLRRLSSGALRG